MWRTAVECTVLAIPSISSSADSAIAKTAWATGDLRPWERCMASRSSAEPQDPRIRSTPELAVKGTTERNLAREAGFDTRLETSERA